ncbi:ANKRD17 [Mytilus edulis]|uniref:ANKRD17 n=1 Tax=Mytilus edulis TaxID=6550 RepID=A0A8S3R4B2_MYTED|nr:ANKRD17 [Mytilus edulis]
MEGIPDDEKNYIIIQLVLTGISPLAVRKIFDNEFHPTRLKVRSTRSLDKSISLKTGVLNQAQIDILYPKDGIEPSSSKFDISLMLCLLRNFTDIDVHDQTPQPNNTKQNIEMKRKWRENLSSKTFCVTKAVLSMFETVLQNQYVAVSGMSGSGKSMVAQHTALRMSESHDYKVVLVSTFQGKFPLKYDHTETSPKILYVLDDVFGKFTLSDYDHVNLNAMFGEMKTIAENNTNCRFLIITRSDAVNVSKMKDVIPSIVECNLHSPELTLSLNERRKIFDLHIPGDIIVYLNNDILERTEQLPLLYQAFTEMFFARMLTEIRKNNKRVFGNIHNKDPSYRKAFLDYLKQYLSNSDLKYIQSPLAISCRFGYEDFVSYIVGRWKTQLIKTLTCSKESPLSAACLIGNINIVKMLIESCTNPDLVITYPLINATEKGFMDIIKFLITHCVYPHVSGALNIAFTCFDPSSNDECLRIACENGHDEIATILLNNGVPVNYTALKPKQYSQRYKRYHPFYEVRLTPLYCAAMKGYLNTVKLLIKAGAKVDESDISVAEWNNHEDIDNYLRQHFELQNENNKNFLIKT